MYHKKDIVAKMLETGMIPVFNHKDLKVCIEVLKVCDEAGVFIFEFTARGPEAAEVFTQLKKYAAVHFPKLILGVGTVLNADSAKFFITEGAHFIVSPILDQETAEECAKHEVLWIPGCGTLTEIVSATKLGADLIKVFPGSVLGPNFISSVLSPIPNLRLMPTGGVETNRKNLEDWFSSGAVCVGMGSQLFSKALIANGDYKTMKENILKVVSTIKEIRAEK